MVHYIEPVLFPVTVDVLEVYKFINKYYIKDADLVMNYYYQIKESAVIWGWSNWDLFNKFIEEWDFLDEEQAHELFANKHYKDQLIFWYCRYLQEVGDTENLEDVYTWLEENHDNWVFRRVVPKPMFLYDINRYYNTIIIPKLWTDSGLGNRLNRIWGEPANYYDQIETIKKSIDHLLNGGKLYLLNERDYQYVVHLLGEFKMIEDNVFQKNEPPKKSKTNNKTIRKWL